MSLKYVYFFSKETTEGNRELKEILGGKGAALAEMCDLGLPIPPGFTITTEVCNLYYENKKNFPQGLKEQVDEKIDQLEIVLGKKFGSHEDPLLLSIRSGAAISMPGMMDSILNLGLNDLTVEGLAKCSSNVRFAYDSYRRFIQMFGDVVFGIDRDRFENILEDIKSSRGVFHDVELTGEDLKEVVSRYKELFKNEVGFDFPQDFRDQLWKAIAAVFESWNNERAKTYRRLENITGLLGTAVNIQAMVYGNLGETSGTGVAFSRNASTGENEFFAEYLMNAQGEDVVAGIRTPRHINELSQQLPKIYQQLLQYKDILERHYRDMQDIEFTIQEGTLYILQTRTGKRTPQAAIKIALDMAKEGMISRTEAIMRVNPKQLSQLLHPNIDTSQKYEALATGLPASPGAAVGKIVFTARSAEIMAAKGERVVLLRKETSPEDIAGMDASQGILTSTGGLTSHAAVVARGMGKCCVAGCGELIVKSDNTCEIAGKLFEEGDYLTLNGSTGEVIEGQLQLTMPEISGSFKEFLQWVDEVKTIRVRTNADSAKDSIIAREFGAEGIGLCRTEHMFFEKERIDAVREMIFSEEKEERILALSKILPMQMNDFITIFEAMDGFPVTIRLLDPPLHEFLPHSDEDLEKLSKSMGTDISRLEQKKQSLKEFNPMLGHRGCRLAISYPEIAEMQTEAIIKAALAVKAKGIKVSPEIMVPLIGIEREFEFLKEVIDQKAEEIFSLEKCRIEYKVGSMIEIPRACLVADRIAKNAEFFSFGTNDLTQMTFGFSRDDTGPFLKEYLRRKILTEDPFQILDQTGVGELIKIAIKKGRSVRKDLKVGICGEHGGEPKSVEFCVNNQMDYVSCSPYRVPIARLAAAQTKIKNIAQ
ncbi:MAG: pyruvate, phosphate dikinase [Candidatus Aminicenantes bacterium]|nr:pyruvate, phosphate dikinase [Candidatus Aminicenantes bacterium]